MLFGTLPAMALDKRVELWYTVAMRSKLELLKFFSSFDGEADMSDFTPAELEARLSPSADPEAMKRKYFDFYDDVKSPSLKKQDW